MPDNVPFAEWRPDLSDRANPASEAKGVISVGGQYAPFKTIVDYNGSSAASAAQCLGAHTNIDSTTVPHIYMGDTSKLYHLESRVAVDRSKAGGYSIVTDQSWQFAQFGDNTYAVAKGTAPQLHNMLTPATAFADVAGSPPTDATSVARVGDFLWMGKDFTTFWSGFNNPATWTPSVATQAGNQALDQEQGRIQTIIGLDYAAIFQERAIRRAIYVGPPVIWDFGQDYVEKQRGCISRNAADKFGRGVFYVADDGFYIFDGQQSVPIGYGKVDEYFARNLNYGFRHKVCAAVDPINKLFVVGFPAAGAQNISELLIYSMNDNKWTHDTVDLEFLLATPVDVLTVDTFQLLIVSDNLDDPVLDPYSIDSGVFDDARRLLAGVQLNHRLGTFSGANRPAILETGEFEPAPGMRARVTEIWPLGDFPQTAVSAAIGYRRAQPSVGVQYTNPTNMNNTGFCPQLWDARFLRGRLIIAGAAAWRRAEGIHYTAGPSGSR